MDPAAPLPVAATTPQQQQQQQPNVVVEPINKHDRATSRGPPSINYLRYAYGPLLRIDLFDVRNDALMLFRRPMFLVVLLVTLAEFPLEPV